MVNSNALSGETSPYLLQHADNPVNWYPWGPEALQLAKRENKPILLSIGYSACHWCHVMAHESFEDKDTAALMNDNFVNIKVDREERPDLDKIYQTAHQMLTHRSGGWPLTMFLTAEDQTPFFGGTYFPRESRYGLPGFKELLQRIADLYREEPMAIREQKQAILGTFEAMDRSPVVRGAEITAAPLEQARHQIAQSYEPHRGGFSPAPKFPHPSTIERLLRHYAATVSQTAPDKEALNMALFTLDRMANGGVYDQIGGGFCRYSVDADWMIPHFEKMLYDNGPLLGLYCEAWQISADPVFRKAAVETADWVMREMQSPEGGFYSSLDADSEGREGKFYLWDPGQVKTILDEREYALFARRFGLDRAPNFEGAWHLHVFASMAELAKEFDMPEGEAGEILDEARRKLLHVRNQRVWPCRDEKILTSWNGLMIKGMALAGRLLGRDDYIQSAERALDFIREVMWRESRLLATYKDGKAHLNAYLDDYAFLIDGTLTLLQAHWRADDLAFAIRLADALLERFEDKESGGFFFTSHDHEKLLRRSKSLHDDALPSGAGIAALVLGRFGHLLAEPRYLEAVAKTLKSAWLTIERYPSACNALLLALEEYLTPPQTTILRGPIGEIDKWQRRCATCYAPQRTAFAIPDDTVDLPKGLLDRASPGTPVAYLCEGHRCGPPITDFDIFDTSLKHSEVHSFPST